jgi:hypothetical protein
MNTEKKAALEALIASALRGGLTERSKLVKKYRAELAKLG